MRTCLVTVFILLIYGMVCAEERNVLHPGESNQPQKDIHETFSMGDAKASSQEAELANQESKLTEQEEKQEKRPVGPITDGIPPSGGGVASPAEMGSKIDQ